MKNTPKVTVLILSYNGVELLEDSISSYLQNDYQNFDVVVIDNGSTDNTLEYLEQNWQNIKVLKTIKNLGYSGGFNFGLDFCFNNNNSEYVIITNNDVKVDKNVISKLVETSRISDNIGFVTGKVYYFDHPDVLQTVGKHKDNIRWNGAHIGSNEIDNGQFDNIAERTFIDDIYMLVKKSVYNKIGGYDTLYQFQCEEWDWQARAKIHGFKIYYTPDAKIWHKESMTIGKKSAFKAYYDAKNPMVMIYSHKGFVFFVKFFVNHFWSHIFKASIKSLIFDFDLKKFYKIWLGFVHGVTTILNGSAVVKSIK
ncbi:glycosyltransferase family 2 protein [Flavobacteriaceae bacterium]|nr:glycosyltransferase family 2 protein [Flavobacteriaceae bacterium]